MFKSAQQKSFIHWIEVEPHIYRIIGKTFYVFTHSPQTGRMHGINLHSIFIS